MFQENKEATIIGFVPPWTQEVCCAYVLTHLATGKVYIGSTLDIYRRRTQHLSDLRNGKHTNIELQQLFNQSPFFKLGVYVVPDYYGEERKEKAFDIEQYLLNYYTKTGNLVNIASDARRANLGRRHTEKTKQLISIASTGRKLSDETRAKLSALMNDPKRKALMLSFNIGKTVSDTTKEKLKVHSNKPEYIQYRRDLMKDKQRSVIVDGVTYFGVIEAAKQLNISKQMLIGRLKNKNFPTYRYV